MKQKFFPLSLLVVIFLFAGKVHGQAVKTAARVQRQVILPRSLPENEGVSSEGILQFLDAAQKSRTEFHSFMMLRHGKVIAESWWAPYAADIKHTMYSCSKSFTATAIGFAVAEKKVKIDDKVISFFPQDLPDSVSLNLSELSIKELLSMSVGQEADPTLASVSKDSNWVRSFLALPIKYKPGSVFLYNSLGTYMLSAIIQKVTGQKVVDYLKPRLFAPLGITDMDWEVDPRGINTGGWGLRIKTEDMAKFGQLFLQKGRWNGKQLLPEAWIEEASSLKIVQHPAYSQTKRDSSDWEQGYCYQMWRCRNNAYRGDGAFGQFIIVMPDQDVVIALTAETPDMQEEINLVWEYLLPAINNGKLPANKKAALDLKYKLSSLKLPVPVKSSSSLAAEIDNKTFTMLPNEKNIASLSFHFQNNKCELTIAGAAGTFKLGFGGGAWVAVETKRKAPSLVAAAKASLTGLPPFKINGAYSWLDEHTLQLTLRYIQSPHTETISCYFDGRNVAADFENSFDFGKKKTQLKGTVTE